MVRHLITFICMITLLVTLLKYHFYWTSPVIMIYGAIDFLKLFYFMRWTVRESEWHKFSALLGLINCTNAFVDYHFNTFCVLKLSRANVGCPQPCMYIMMGIEWHQASPTEWQLHSVSHLLCRCPPWALPWVWKTLPLRCGLRRNQSSREGWGEGLKGSLYQAIPWALAVQAWSKKIHLSLRLHHMPKSKNHSCIYHQVS